VHAFVAHARAAHPAALGELNVTVHPSEEAAVGAILGRDGYGGGGGGGERAWGAVIFHELSPASLNFSIRLNYSTLPNTNWVTNWIARGAAAQLGAILGAILRRSLRRLYRPRHPVHAVPPFRLPHDPAARRRIRLGTRRECLGEPHARTAAADRRPRRAAVPDGGIRTERLLSGSERIWLLECTAPQ